MMPSQLALPRLDIEVINHDVLTSFIWVIEWDLVLIATRSGNVRPTGVLDADARAEVIRRVRSDDDLQQIGVPMPNLGTKIRYYGNFGTAITGDGLLGRPGHRRLLRSPVDRRPIDLDQPRINDEPTPYDQAEGLACRDDDCDGLSHGWLRIELPSREFLIWHINPVTGRVVPPSPMVLH